MKDQAVILNRGPVVGNCALFWREGGCGYTTDLDHAGKFPMEDAIRRCRHRPLEDFAIPDETGTWVDAPAGGYPRSAVLSHGCCGPCDEARHVAAGLVPPSERNEGREV